MESSVKELSRYRYETSLEDLDAYFNQNYVKTGVFPKEL